MDAPEKSKENAYQAFIKCGQNLTDAVKELKKQGYKITRQTLSAWKSKYDWQGRAARVDAEERRSNEALSDYSLLKPLLAQLPKYEEYFNTLALGKIDNQAVYARNSIIKTIFSIKESIEKRKGSIDESQGSERIEERIIKTPQDAVAALEEVFQKKINKLLSQPDQVKKGDMKECDEIQAQIEKFKSKYTPDKEENKEIRDLSKEEKTSIRRIYGLDD